MKKIFLLIILATTISCQSQTPVILKTDATLKLSWGTLEDSTSINPKWDSTKESICGLGKYCPFLDGSHYYTKVPPEPYGTPVYGSEGAFVGTVTSKGVFIATRRRDHLIGKPADKALLEDPVKLLEYIKYRYNL